MAGTLKRGMTGLHLQRLQRNFSAIKIKEIDADGKESYVIKEYSPELLKELEKTLLLGFSLLMLWNRP
jgi:hypothetical protein